MVEPLAQVYHDQGKTDLVEEIGHSNRIELGTTIERAAYQASNLEDMLHQEQGRHAAFEVEAENLRPSQGTTEVEDLALQTERDMLVAKVQKLREEGVRPLGFKI
ncbi:hypothetical protein GUJ93_ZPchr0010g9717 [Zizania palustris]|uniref:Uncharacterized protein n=1 Tax=Zizania palustris TaxID=103762 RepID=A0A8J5TDY5_ZIZPA|nr:hypothetical protein GUJ93_ZPchr0010g9717 [Zizania palustris]